MSMTEAQASPVPLAPVQVRRVIAAPPADVFAAWTDPTILAEWFGSMDVTVTHAEVDAREGGAYRIVMRGAQTGRLSNLFGTYTTMRVPERLAFTWHIEGADGAISPQSLVTVDFAALDRSRTEISLTHTLLSTEDARRGVRRGWGGSFDKLNNFFTAQRTTRG